MQKGTETVFLGKTPRSPEEGAHSASARNANLDLLRALAIVMVIANHLFLTWPGKLSWLSAITRYGEFGVDLFFVLSGWLIGGLFWKEHRRFGNIETGRFMARRALRTIPPYLVALVISFGAVKIMRNEPFDWRYLLFLQNYQTEIPFFQVSWSLCVEEHFYLLMPLFALAWVRLSPRYHSIFFVILSLPILFRAWNLPDPGAELPFGFLFSATHLRYEGLLLGVWGSYLHHYQPGAWAWLRKMAPAGFLLSLCAAIWSSSSPVVEYVFFYSAASLTFWFLLIAVVDRKPLPFADSHIVFWIAMLSYSAYLTNQLVIHAHSRIAARVDFLPEAAQIFVAVAGIALAAFLFYRCVEAPSLRLRQKWVPNRSFRKFNASQ